MRIVPAHHFQMSGRSPMQDTNNCVIASRARHCVKVQSRGHSAHIGQDVIIHYRWHPLYGRSVRCVQSHRRTSGDVVHVELSPDAVTIVPAWKLDAVYCAGLRVGPPQVSLASLRSLHELLIACESRLVSADGNIANQETQDGSAVTARTEDRECF